MVRVSGREYNGLIETPCYQRGELSCLSCHQMHQAPCDTRPAKEWADDQLKVGMRGNQACLQCHNEYRREERLTQHTHHPAASSGSVCYNCHMPYTTYGLHKAIRSHQIDSPTVAASLSTGRPNACNQCHLDQTLKWTSQHLDEWYGISQPSLTEDEQTIAASVLWLLRGDAGQRALMAWSMGWSEAHAASGANWQAALVAELLEDPYDAVRLIASRALEQLRVSASGDSETVSRSRAAILRDETGALMRSELQRLHKQRDDREIRLLE
jgi:formate-dependent nitrite reductase cytochrome c552 subunit